jgi:hypothetical protein
MGTRQELLAIGALAILLQPALPATADQLPSGKLTGLMGCEAFDVGSEMEPAACVRCKPGYQLSSTKTCLRLGDFGSTRDSIFRGMRRR